MPRVQCSDKARLYYGEIVSGYAFKVGVHDMVLNNQARSAIKKLLDIHRWSEYGIWYQKARKSTDDDESQKMFVEASRRGPSLFVTITSMVFLF